MPFAGMPDNLDLLPDGSRNGSPIVTIHFNHGADCDAGFVRRDDHGQPGSVGCTVQFSADLVTFEDSASTPVFVADSIEDLAREVIKLPCPLWTQDGKKARFFRLKITLVPSPRQTSGAGNESWPGPSLAHGGRVPSLCPVSRFAVIGPGS